MQGNNLPETEVWWWPRTRILVLSLAAFAWGLLFPWLVPLETLTEVSSMAEDLIAGLANGEEAMWSGFMPVFGSYLLWPLAVWLAGWLPSRFPATVIFLLRLALLGFCLMLLIRVDYSYGLLIGLLVLLPGEILLSASLLWQCLLARCQAASIKQQNMFFSPWRYLSLGVVLLLPALVGCWLKTAAGPWILNLVLNWI